jgi:EF-P beta-lysylation protein EpmB
MSGWQKILRRNFTSWKKLADFLELDTEQRQVIAPHPDFPLSLPYRLAIKVEKRRLDDPILKQFLATKQEELITPGFSSDPLAEGAARSCPRMLQKYAGRALLMPSAACAMQCRYCFRRHFEYAQGRPDLTQELAAIQADSTLSEVILSGGDPLTVPNQRLDQLLDAIDAIPHVQRIRFHTRLPIGIPERIDEPFLAILEKRRCQIWFVVHCNHPRELDSEVAAALKQVQRLGIPVLNQAVLLAGVNDDVETLYQLCLSLTDVGIIPYYLFQLDRVQGTAHFEVPMEQGLQLVEQLQTMLPGYAVPRFAQEVASQPSKTVLHPIPS